MTVSGSPAVRILSAAQPLESPAFVYDEPTLARTLRAMRALADASGAHLLFAVKALAVRAVLADIAAHSDGFAASSLFEARLAREVLAGKGTVHVTTPGLRPDEIDAIAELCDFVTLNSLSQWDRFRGLLATRTRCGLRVNPNLSLVADVRYDPCRLHSKLGVPLDHLVEVLECVPARLDGVTGLHFHTNCVSADFRALAATVRHLEAHLGALLERARWINLGGGYLFDTAANPDAFHEAVDRLRANYGLEVFIEPGAAVTRKAAYLVATVLDLFVSGGKTVAVLDTAINHLPEVFEYQFRPDVVGHREDGRHRYILAGCTCLAGDLFGEYGFDQPLEVGARVIFANAGAYTLVKANMFNGVNLPTIYALTEAGELVAKKRFTYEEFAGRWGVPSGASRPARV